MKTRHVPWSSLALAASLAALAATHAHAQRRGDAGDEGWAGDDAAAADQGWGGNQAGAADQGWGGNQAGAADQGWGAPDEGGAPTDEADEGGDTGASEDGEEKKLTAWLTPGFGATQRVIELGSIAGRRKLDTSLVPAFELALRGSVASDSFLFDVALGYQSSLFSEGTQTAPSSVGSTTPIRSHRFEGGVAPGVRLGSGDSGVTLQAFVGYVLRSFASEEEILMPRHTLHGPALRLEIGIPIAGIVHLRLAPEVQVIAAMSRALRETGHLDSQGWAAGGEAGLRVRALSWLWAGASYRESHLQVGSALDTSLTDVERYLFVEAWIRYY